jgi:hypothetical protein
LQIAEQRLDQAQAVIDHLRAGVASLETVQETARRARRGMHRLGILVIVVAVVALLIWFFRKGEDGRPPEASTQGEAR